MSPEKIKEKLKDAKGVRVVSAEQTKDEVAKTQTAKVELAFDSLEALYTSGAMESAAVKLEKLADGNYKLTRNLAGAMGGESASDSPEAQQMLEGMMAMFEPMMSGMELAFTITLPTEVVETNGTKDGNTVSWKAGFKDLMKPETRIQTVLFKAEGLDWKPFDAKPAEKTPPEEPEAPDTPEEQPTEEGGN